jgi:hypothetical protein
MVVGGWPWLVKIPRLALRGGAAKSKLDKIALLYLMSLRTIELELATCVLT